MVDLANLTSRSRRSYELGRLRRALRVAALVLPIVVVGGLVARDRLETCCALGLGLLVLATFLRWRNRSGERAVFAGLAASVVPLVAGLALACTDVACGGRACAAISGAAGLVAGILAARNVLRRDEGPVAGLFAASVAIVAACIGCLSLGIASVVGVGVGVLLGTVATFVVRPAKT